jgi:hypothetical protein
VLVTNHVLSGVLIGAVIKRPLPAFAVGVASHFVLDSLPHWGERGIDKQRFLRIARTDGLTGLAAMAAFATIAPPERRVAVLASMAGAALPDLDKPARLWFGRSPWPAAVNRFHGRIQNEAPDRFPRELTTMGLLAVAGLAAMRASRRKTTTTRHRDS